ncbi:hypothetical protein C8Q76DRAFT_701623 [Earliella scabrosa]|nr:hypothetical protein C8Q76DRAFT_701623 [Earliella scabrosa]
MDQLPVEVLHLIFEFASTDGGYTACSLSLTSKAVKAIAQTTSFHSVALVVERRCLDTFLASYKTRCSLPEHPRLKVAHLHLRRKRERPYVVNDLALGEDDEDERFPSYVSAARELFRLCAADDLQSLVIPYLGMYDLPLELFNRPFASLRELTLLGHGLTHIYLAANTPLSPLFPALTHLHIVAPRVYNFSFKPWIAHAPRVTHLRCSCFPLFGEPLKELPAVLGTPPYPYKGGRRHATVGPAPAQRSYPSLRDVIIQPEKWPRPGWGWPRTAAFMQFSQTLDWIAARAQTAELRVHVLAPYARAPEWEERARSDWERRVFDGLCGDWLTDEDAEEEREVLVDDERHEGSETESEE